VDQEALVRYFTDLEFKPGENPNPKQVKERWKKLCRGHHPDAGGSQEEFLRVTHAYSMLTDLEYRHRHMLTAGRRQSPNSVGDLNIRIQVPLKFEDAFFGRDIVISYNRLILNEADLTPVTGLEEADLVSHKLTIPAGAVEGYHTQVGGLGHKCGSTLGDALFIVTPLPHTRFQVRDQNVYATEQVPLKTTLKGGDVEVTTMYGIRTLRVPPGTVPGAQLRIKDCGVGGKNFHVAVVEILFPSRDELKDSAWAGLGINWSEVEARDKEEEDLMARFRQATTTSGGIQFIFR
jgi:DnaJ-class molecular chaperone